MTKAVQILNDIIRLARELQQEAKTVETVQVGIEIAFAAESARTNETLDNPSLNRPRHD